MNSRQEWKCLRFDSTGQFVIALNYWMVHFADERGKEEELPGDCVDCPGKGQEDQDVEKGEFEDITERGSQHHLQLAEFLAGSEPPNDSQEGEKAAKTHQGVIDEERVVQVPAEVVSLFQGCR